METNFGDLIDLFFVDAVERLELLTYAAAELLAADVNKGCEVGKADALTAVLTGCDLRDDLRCDIARGGKAVRLFDHGAADNGAVLEHILEIDEIAVVHMLCEIVRVMEMDDALIVCGNDVCRQKDSSCDILADFTCHVVALNAVDGRIFIGVFLLDLFVVTFDEGHDLFVGGVGLTNERTVVAIGDVTSCYVKRAEIHDLIFYHVLNFFNAEGTVDIECGAFHVFCDTFDLHRGETSAWNNAFVCLGNGDNDLVGVEYNLCTVALDDFHSGLLFFYKILYHKCLMDCMILGFAYILYQYPVLLSI